MKDELKATINPVASERLHNMVEVVRCKDCKYWDIDWTPDKRYPNEHWCPYVDQPTESEFYCADGEEQEHECK